jgi:large subunit ribosomal protein L10
MRQEKQLLLDEIKGKIDGSTALVLTRYSKLTPNAADGFRRSISNAGGAYAVVRKRVLMKAAEKGGISLDPEMLKGNIGVMFAYEDPLKPTKALFQFADQNKDSFEILAGHFEGKLCSAADVKAISELPTQDAMRAQFLGLLEAPMSQTLAVMEALLTSIMYCLENKSKE